MKFPFEVIYEDNHLLVVNKPAGLLVQGDATGDMPLAEYGKEYLRQKYDKPGNVFCGVAHRIDRPVSGVVVLARTSKALERLNKAFHDRQVKKTYWALVANRPEMEEDTLTHFLVKDTNKNITTAYNKAKHGAQIAVLSYKILKSFKSVHLLEVMPETGRPHQIRVQLAKIGCPIIGDLRYGAAKTNEDASICLHARSLSFMHPVKNEEVKFTASLPILPIWNGLER